MFIGYPACNRLCLSQKRRPDCMPPFLLSFLSLCLLRLSPSFFAASRDCVSYASRSRLSLSCPIPDKPVTWSDPFDKTLRCAALFRRFSSLPASNTFATPVGPRARSFATWTRFMNWNPPVSKEQTCRISELRNRTQVVRFKVAVKVLSAA